MSKHPKHSGNYERNSWNTNTVLLDLILKFTSIYDQYYLASYTECNYIEDLVQYSGGKGSKNPGAQICNLLRSPGIDSQPAGPVRTGRQAT